MSDWTWIDAPSIPTPSHARSEQEYLVHLAAREWSINPPILIRSAEDIESRRHWSATLEPYKHQVKNLITFCRRAPVALIADDVGLGKTISAGLVISELMTRKQVRRVLVVCPAILMSQWADEMRTMFGLKASYGTGRELQSLITGRDPIVITTYQSARGQLGSIPGDHFDMLVLDEAHKLRNLHGTHSAPQFASAVRERLASRAFRFVLMLTATPIQNRLWDLYSLVDLLTAAKGHDNPFGSPRDFKRDYIADRDARKLHPHQQARFRSHLSQYMVRTRRVDCGLAFPQRRVSLRAVPPTTAELQLYRSVGAFVGALGPLAQTTVLQAMLSSPQALVRQLGNMGANDLPLGQAVVTCANAVERTSKMDGLITLLSELARSNPESWRAVVFTTRRETQLAIQKEIAREFGADAVGLIKGADPEQNRRSIECFRRQPTRMRVIVSTDAGAEGVNLQVANVVVNFDLPWNPMVVEQRIGRVQRLGSRFEHVVVVNLVLAETPEARIVARLAEKLQLVAESIGDIESVLESVASDDDEGAFVEVIRKLVVASLQGKDVDEELRLKTESVEAAKRLYEEQKQTVDETVGAMDAMHREGTQPPELTKVARSMKHSEFVEQALRLDGATIQVVPPGLIVRTPGSNDERVYFDRADMESPAAAPLWGSPRAKLYAPGEQVFEQLVGKWKDRGDTFVCRAKGDGDEEISALVNSWVGQFAGGRLVRWTTTATAEYFSGSLQVQADATVDHDRYQTIFGIEVGSGGEGRECEPNPQQPVRDFKLAAALPQATQLIAAAVERNQDIRSFCSYYAGRRAEEMRRAAAGSRESHRAAQAFTPNLAAGLIGVRGVAFRQVTVQVEFSLNAGMADTAELELIPATGTILRQPEIRTCDVTGQRAPASHLGTCSVSKKCVLKSLLSVSALSGLRALPEYCKTCAHTGDLVLVTELGTSEISGKTVRQDLLVESAMSRRRGMKEEFVTCQFTSGLVAPDEVVRSDVSGRLLRSDQAVTSNAKGLRGHQSEFVTCQASQELILPEESAQSDLSGRRVKAALLQSSERPPHRRGLAVEIVNCAVTGRRLLRDEVVFSAVSQRPVDDQVAVRSDRSGLPALPEEVGACEVTRRRLLTSELGRCEETGKVIDRDLLEASRISKRVVQKTLLVTCPESGLRGLPGEMEICGETSQRVAPMTLGVSAVSGRKAIRRLMKASAVSGKLMLTAEGVCSAKSGQYMLREEAVRSEWDGKAYLPGEIARCRLSGVMLSVDQIGPDGAGFELRRVLDGIGGKPNPPAELLAYLRARDPKVLGDLRELRHTVSPHGQVIVFCGEHRTLFGFRSKWIGGYFRVGPAAEVLGTLASGARKGGRWIEDS